MCGERKDNCVLYEKDRHVARITLNKPEKRNALDEELSRELCAALQKARDDDDVRAVVLTGNGTAFCAGGDVARFPEFGLEESISFVRDGQKVVPLFTEMFKPIVAAVNGAAVGAGLSIVLLCDIVISSDRAKYGAAFVKVGLVPDLAALYLLPRAVGLQKAKELSFTGKSVSAEEACSLGIVNRVVPHEELESAVQQLARTLTSGSASAIGAAKRLLNLSMDMDLKGLLEAEALTQGICMVSEDSREGVDAFLNKREAVFNRGR